MSLRNSGWPAQLFLTMDFMVRENHEMRFRGRLCCGAVMLCAMIAARPARAVIVPLEDQRYVAVYCSPFNPNCTELFVRPQYPPAEFDGNVGIPDSEASQHSRIDIDSLSGRGSTGSYGGGGPPTESRFQVVFTVAQMSSYSFNSSLYSGWLYVPETGGGYIDTPDERSASLQAGPVDLFRTNEVHFSNTGLLVPGERYTLSLWNRNRGQQFYGGGWDFTFTTSIPEPPPLLILTLAVLATGLRQRLIA